MKERTKAKSAKSNSEIIRMSEAIAEHLKYSKIKSRIRSSDVRKLTILAQELYDREGVQPSTDHLAYWVRDLLMPSSAEVTSIAFAFKYLWLIPETQSASIDILD